MADRLVRLRDGRQIGMSGHGDPMTPRVLVFCHPAPGASGFDPDPALTESWGVHMVSVGRPGYGPSTALADEVRPTLARHADDVAEYLTQVVQYARQSGTSPVRQVGVVGWSFGGRVALALAAQHPGLVDRVAVVATSAPDSAVRGLPDDVAALHAELAAMPVVDAKHRLRALLEAQGHDDLAALADEEADRATLGREGLRGRLERMVAEAYTQHVVGQADDVLSTAGEWGIDLARVRAPVLLVYGGRDPAVPPAHGRWYRRHLPHARLHVEPDAGHLVVAEAWSRILAHVDPNHGTRAGA